MRESDGKGRRKRRVEQRGGEGVYGHRENGEVHADADDRPAAESTEEERQYFSHVGFERQAISRKPTMVSELIEDFIADKRLWRWLEEAMACSKNNAMENGDKP